MRFQAKTFTTILTAINLLLLYEAVKAEECETLSIREYEHLRKLQNCTVILGNLDVMFFNEENYTAKEVNQRTFPLREVTGFMFITGLPHVDSLGQMFPNLTIIRGQKLFFNYAFIVYDTGLKEISLRNLLKISRGSVRIDGNNARLCLPKIDWDSIIVSGKLITGKTLSQDCSRMKFEQCASCPEKRCWSSKACQRFESTFLPKPPYITKRCHPLCLGDCVSTDSSAKGCYTCRDISEGSECVESCSDNKLLHVETRRCILVDECKQKNRIIHENSCLQACPPGFSTKVDITSETKSYECQKCINHCPKYCEVPEIRTISQLESIGIGCTVVNGSLEINMYEDISNATAELVKYLGSVEEILGTLRIHRSSPITELTFLNRLRVIHGNNKTAIQIFENQNLQTIFDWQERGNMKLKVKRGNVLIYNNILLCQNETRRFEEILSRTPQESDLIHNNGAKNKCVLPTIEVGFKVWSHESVAVRWKDVNTKLKRRFNAYIIQYVAMETSSILEDKLLLERDSCSSYGWQHTFVRRDDCRDIGNGYLEYNLTGLEQFTFHALSIQTYHYGAADDNDSPLQQSTLEHDGEISAVKTFQTLLKIPSRVRNLRTIEKSPEFIKLQWDVTASEQAAIKFFYIDVIEKPFNKTLIDRRNYCTEPIEASENDEYMETFNTDSKSVANPFFDLSLSCCDQCCQMRQDFKDNWELEDIDFQANLVKYSEEGPRRTFQPRLQSHRKFVERSTVPSTDRTYLVENLQPFTHYTFYLHACLSDDICGDFEFHSEMTSATLNQSYDRVKVHPSRNIFEEKEFHIYLEEPVLANGVIIKYIAEFWQVVSNFSVRLSVHCITRKELQLNESRFTADHLAEGVYMFRAMAISLASMGPFSEFHEFQIVKPDKSLSKGWIVAFVFIFMLATAVAAISYYYKHKFFIMKRGQNDRMILMKDIEPTDFNAMNNRHQRDFDELSDIMEYDE